MPNKCSVCGRHKPWTTPSIKSITFCFNIPNKFQHLEFIFDFICINIASSWYFVSFSVFLIAIKYWRCRIWNELFSDNHLNVVGMLFRYVWRKKSKRDEYLRNDVWLMNNLKFFLHRFCRLTWKYFIESLWQYFSIKSQSSLQKISIIFLIDSKAFQLPNFSLTVPDDIPFWNQKKENSEVLTELMMTIKVYELSKFRLVIYHSSSSPPPTNTLCHKNSNICFDTIMSNCRKYFRPSSSNRK